MKKFPTSTLSVLGLILSGAVFIVNREYDKQRLQDEVAKAVEAHFKNES